MPKRNDIKSVLIIGSGPIIIGQACEFDYSGAQACKALKEEGYRTILVNSNPATIMTDPSLSDATYIEPLTVEFLTRIIEKERPDALLPTIGGQTALNLSLKLHEAGILEKYKVEMLGAKPDVIHKAEDRKAFKKAMEKIGLSLPKSEVTYSLEEAKKIALELGFPCVVRPSFTMGGTGGGIAYNMEELEDIAGAGIHHSMISEILIEESIIGWKEFEMEVMRDRNDNTVIICSIENFDPMGVHTGDSITVAPAQTLTDKEYQLMRDASIAIMREIGVETGGSNVQFAINPKNGRMIVIEMNPRVSRSSALASKATGFPIAKFAAKLAVGYTLDELNNDITKKTPACFEPSIDYCVVKIPRFNFEKFPQTSNRLGTAMKSVGEAMSIGRTFKEAFQKGLRSLEIKRFGFGFDGKGRPIPDRETIISDLSKPHPGRVFVIQEALKEGFSVEEICEYSGIDPWFINQLKQIVTFAQTLTLNPADMRKAKRMGFSNVQLAELTDLKNEVEIKTYLNKHKIVPTYKLVDTCAAEFESFTPYFYSTYEEEDESRVTENKKVMILGGGPNRIGQGIEFDYCCVHASLASRELGFESIMVNSNPETVSTDYDISSKLFFEPLTFEDVVNIYEKEKPEGVIIQFGGQTPLNLAEKLEKYGVNILGTSPKSVALAEDRELFSAMLNKLKLKQPENGLARTEEEAVTHANRIGYPVLLRPSFVLGGASMEIVYSENEVRRYINQAIDLTPEKPVLIDQYLESAVEIDVDALSDGKDCVIAGIMEHIEEAGIHSGDSACALPPYSLGQNVLDEIEESTKKLAKELQVKGLLNIQFAVKDNVVYILEVNPRGSRTVPFVSKATSISWANLATKVILGKKIKDLNIVKPILEYTAVKEAVFPFNRFPGVDILLGPEMKSTGEVMGLDKDFGTAYLKAQLGAGQMIPSEGTVFLSVKDSDKAKVISLARELDSLGFKLIATKGTQKALKEEGIESESVLKVLEGRPNVVDSIKNKSVQLVINTPSGKHPMQDEASIRQAAMYSNIPVITTVAGAIATVKAMRNFKIDSLEVTSLQSLNKI